MSAEHQRPLSLASTSRRSCAVEPGKLAKQPNCRLTLPRKLDVMCFVPGNVDTTGGSQLDDVMVDCHLAPVRMAQPALHIVKPNTQGTRCSVYCVFVRGRSAVRVTGHCHCPTAVRQSCRGFCMPRVAKLAGREMQAYHLSL